MVLRAIKPLAGLQEHGVDLDNQQQREHHELDDPLRVRDAVDDGEIRGHGLAASITGPPGSGKNYVASKLAEPCAVEGRSVSIVTPTGALAEVFQRRYLLQFEMKVGTSDCVFRRSHRLSEM